MRLVLVEWEDSCSGSTWMGRDSEWPPASVTSIGILAREDDKQIELIPNIGISSKLHQIAIPKGCIRRVRRVKVTGNDAQSK